jgi:hypothetical protein
MVMVLSSSRILARDGLRCKVRREGDWRMM